MNAFRRPALSQAAWSAFIALAIVAAGVSSAAAASADYISNQADWQDAKNLSGTWWATTYTHALKPLDGKSIPFTPAGQAMFNKTIAGLKDGSVVDRARHTCLPAGVPRVMTTVYPFLIVQTPGQVTMLFEQNRDNRIIRLNAKHFDPSAWDPSYMGESVGHWEGNALVIETKNFKPNTFLDDAGLPHTDQAVVSERLSKPAGGTTLQDDVTITDPSIYAKPWTARLTYASKPGLDIATDWVCGEGHRDTSDVAGAPRK